MLKRIILILLYLFINTSISYSVNCTKEVCLKVPWPKECDKYCAGAAIENASYSELIQLFRFTSDLAGKIIQTKEDKRLTGINIIEKLERRLSPEELCKVYNTIESLSSQDQREIIRRGLINMESRRHR